MSTLHYMYRYQIQRLSFSPLCRKISVSFWVGYFPPPLTARTLWFSSVRPTEGIFMEGNTIPTTRGSQEWRLAWRDCGGGLTMQELLWSWFLGTQNVRNRKTTSWKNNFIPKVPKYPSVKKMRKKISTELKRSNSFFFRSSLVLHCVVYREPKQ